ncbi:hypothetical protein ACOMHN_039274 [Nucella lapillus]
MEAKLAEYRQRKLKEQRLKENASRGFFGLFRRAGTTSTTEPRNKEEESRTAVSTPIEQEKNQDSNNAPECDLAEDTTESPPQKFSWLLFVLKIALWFTVWLIFIELQFGAVFFVVSALVFVYFNTRTGRRRQKSTLSAYSVFNPNCERLQGTITAEQFEAELLHRKPLEAT